MPTIQPEPHKIQAWAEINRKYLGQGVRVKRFRRPKRSQIRNRVLLAILMAKDVKLSQFAEELSISSRSVSAWVYEGRIPSRINMDKACRILGYPAHILFNEALINDSPILCQPYSSRFMKRAQSNSPKRNKILLGLCMVYDLSVTDVSHWISIHPGTFRKWLHYGHLPSPVMQDKAAEFFKVPPTILFADCDA
ncbi:helix-turn-helix domain-containing protein [Paenibacillus wynnii]|uniref:DNA-binding protein n=1 Tax=Paenibacillus wynnii TaxID=268407 RepID=A0A098M368_9BACL|nr:helix-turn-helix transcriptional regulator [Paenibacillus wynnii]KGE16433.1 DNA-binding protein [Paenibacillus wynnii]